jgi:hypothetical protein
MSSNLDVPPAYNRLQPVPELVPEAPSASADPPTYTFPSSFQNGALRTPNPLITPNQFKGNLVLLRSFWALRVSVEGSE